MTKTRKIVLLTIALVPLGGLLTHGQSQSQVARVETPLRPEERDRLLSLGRGSLLSAAPSATTDAGARKTTRALLTLQWNCAKVTNVPAAHASKVFEAAQCFRSVFSRPSPPCLGAGLMSSGVARTPGRSMTKLRFSGKLQIEDVRKHSEETIAKLRRLLTDGATAQADPRRKDFYEVENGRVVYYIHIPPTAGKVYLLAIWPKECSSATA